MSTRPDVLAQDQGMQPPNDPAAPPRAFASGAPRPADADPLLAFRPESEGGVQPPRALEPRRPVAQVGNSDATGTAQERTPWNGRVWITVAAAVAVLIGALVYFQAARGASERAEAAAAAASKITTGTAMFSSQPAGVNVIIDGERRGVTPLTLPLPPGQHQVEFVSGDQRRVQPLTVSPGATASQFVEFAASAATTGRIEVASEPSGATVTIDGANRGTTPFTLADVAPGAHTVAVTRGARTLRRTVTVTPGATATVMMTATQSASPEAGWVVFRAPFEMQVFEDGRLLGTTSADRLMLPTGRHDLTVVAAAYNLRDTYAVTVEPGGLAPVSVNVPTALLSVNAQPWADVWIDGRSAGTTPLGNVSIAVGPHEVIWRHPQLGERRQTVSVSAGGTTRVSTAFK